MTKNQQNWTKFKSEVAKLKDVKDLDSLKKELAHLATEIKKFDINAHLSPTAKKRLNRLEKKYSSLLKSIVKIQKQFDVEFNKAIAYIGTSKSDVQKRFASLKKKAKQQKSKFDKTSRTLKKKKKVTKKKVTAKKTTAKKKTTKAKAKSTATK